MDQLIKCEACNSDISITALRCPVCYKERVSQAKEALSKSIAKSTLGIAALLLMGPAAIVGGIVAAGVAATGSSGARRLAKKNGAIDSFYLVDFVVLVTKSEFIYVDTTMGTNEYPGFPRDRIERLSLDAKESIFGKATPLILISYYWPYGKRVVTEKHKFKGKNANELAELAFAKFSEYRIIAKK